jgi:hypothetical protein
MSKSTRCSQSRKISEDDVGQKIYKKQIKRIHHGANPKAFWPLGAGEAIHLRFTIDDLLFGNKF